MINGVLLAAGRGSRYGADKLLEPLADGVPMAVAALRSLLPVVHRAFAVVRPGCGRLAHLLMEEGALVSIFPGADRGMGASLAWGVGVLPEHTEGILMALADMPFILPDSYRQVAEALRGGALIAAPSYHGERGHPVAFSIRLRTELEALSGDEGARSLIARHQEALVLVDVDDPGVLRDIDRPADLER
ncbi:MAG: nucleotidyltransferase family protein [Pseudomonadota bacterium]